MATSSKRAFTTPGSAASRALAPTAGCYWPVPLQETQTLKGRSSSVPVGFPGALKVLFEPSEHLWWVWGLILNAILPLLPSCWGFSFVLGCGVSYFGGIQRSPLDGCSAASCNFRVLTGDDECTAFYATILTCMLRTLNGYSKIVLGSQVIFLIELRDTGHLTKEIYNLGIKVKEKVVFFPTIQAKDSTYIKITLDLRCS